MAADTGLEVIREVDVGLAPAGQVREDPALAAHRRPGVADGREAVAVRAAAAARAGVGQMGRTQFTWELTAFFPEFIDGGLI